MITYKTSPDRVHWQPAPWAAFEEWEGGARIVALRGACPDSLRQAASLWLVDGRNYQAERIETAGDTVRVYVREVGPDVAEVGA